MKCIHCGRRIPEDAFFCPYCGLVVEEKGKEPERTLKDPIVRKPADSLDEQLQQLEKDELYTEGIYDETFYDETFYDEKERYKRERYKKDLYEKDVYEKKLYDKKSYDEDDEGLYDEEFYDEDDEDIDGETEDMSDSLWEKRERLEYLRERRKKKSGRHVGMIGIVVLVMALLMIAIWMIFSSMDANERHAAEERRQNLEEEQKDVQEEDQEADQEEDGSEDVRDITMAFVGEPSDFGEYYKLSVAEASASSVIRQEGTDNSASKAVDGSERTSWQEGADGDGIGESLSFTLSKPCKVKYMSFQVGNWNSQEYYDKNNRPKELEITVGDVTQSVTFPDGKVEYWIELSEECPASEVGLVIQSVYKGSQWDDTCIAEVGIYGRDGSQ